MGARQVRHRAEHGNERLRVTPPQDGDQRSTATDKGLDGPLCDLLPALASM